MKKLFFILFSLVVISSCTREVIITPEEGEDDVTYTTGYLGVVLDNPEVNTRAGGWPYEDYFPNGNIYHDDSKQERWRHNISLVYFDADFLLEQYNIPTITDLTNSSGIASDIYADGKPEYTSFTLGIGDLTITTGAHYFYILANLPSDYMYKLRTDCNKRKGEMTKDEFEKLVIEGYTIENLAGVELYSNTGDLKKRCIMTNVISPAPHYMAPYTIIPGGGGYPVMNGIQMSIGKAFAKVSVAYIPENTNGKLENVEYRIVNDPKHMYLLPNIFKGQVHTPHYDKPVVSGNYQDYFDEYFNANSHIKKTFSNSTNFSFRPATISTDQNKAFAYCMENGNETPLQGNSTMVLVKAKYTPAQWLNPDGTPGNAPLDGTFWRIRNASGKYSAGYYNTEPFVGGTNKAIEYKDGITYYPIWLQTENKYMVERNHYYKIAITEVLSAGAPDLDSVMDPEAPLVYPLTDTKTAVSGNTLPEVAQCIRWKQKN